MSPGTTGFAMFTGSNLLDALVEMLCWVMDNHYEDTETQSEIINEK